MNIADIEASPKPCSKCKHVRPDKCFKEIRDQLDYGKCAAVDRFCTTARGINGNCGPKAKLWDPVIEEDRPVATYDPDTHEAVTHRAFYVGAGCTVFTLIVTVCWLLSWLFGSTPQEDSAARKWRKAYYELSCKSRGLELNTRNYNDYCMDPKTRALYEVD